MISLPLINYVNFDENAIEAITYYKHVFETEEPKIMRYGEFDDSSYQPPEHIKHLVMHCEMSIYGSRLMISDTPRGFGTDYVVGNNITIALVLSDFDLLNKTWNRLAKDAKIITPFEKTFFSKGYGFLYDKFGVGWQFIHE